jgi:hypothetical protein
MQLESDAVALVPRLALKTRFREIGWGSTPPLSAKICISGVMAAPRSPKPSVGVRVPGGTPNFGLIVITGAQWLCKPRVGVRFPVGPPN